VVMVRVTELPDDSPAPIYFEYGAAFEATPRLEPLEVLHDFATIEEVTIVEQITVEPGPVRHLPRVGHFAFDVDEVHGAVPEHRWEGRVARLGSRRIAANGPRAGAPYLLLVHRGRCHISPPCDDAAAFARSVARRRAGPQRLRSRTPRCSSIECDPQLRGLLGGCVRVVHHGVESPARVRAGLLSALGVEACPVNARPNGESGK